MVSILSESRPIRVAVVDDHDMIRMGIDAMFKGMEGMELVGAATNGEAAIQLCETSRPDVILMDLLMPGMDGVTATRLIHERFPDVRVIALTNHTSEEHIHTALQAGAKGYLLKTVSAEELAEAIRAVYSGLDTLSPSILEALVHAPAASSPQEIDPLTERELEVLELLVEGNSNAAIAQKLVLSPTTIKSHVSSILSKLGVTSRTEAVALALRKGLVPK